MPRLWEPEDQTRGPWGSLQVVVGDHDVTYFRDAPVLVPRWSSSDPFDDSSAELVFPQVTFFDALGTGDLEWLKDYADVDIYHVRPNATKVKLWEGFIVGFDPYPEEMRVTCLGALYQLDLYTAQPKHLTYESRKTHENLIREQLLPRARRPHLRLSPLDIDWPDDWDVQDSKGRDVTSDLRSRYTGEWDPVLTGYLQDLLVLMRTKDGGQWTLMKKEGRKPVLRVKTTDDAQWTLSAGSPGVEVQLSRDLMQAAHIIYGQGEDEGGSTWTGADVRFENNRPVTYYEPLAWDQRAYPPDNDQFDPDMMTNEVFYNFGPFVTRREAEREAAKLLARDRDPGWFGSVTLGADPEEGSRFEVKAGDNIRLKEFAGSGPQGVIVHVAESDIDMEQGTNSLTVDTKARDLLTLSEVIARNRDAKTPHRLLQVNRRSHVVEDRYRQWDYSAGSGFIPRKSREMGFHRAKELGEKESNFPHQWWTNRYPPRSNPEFYVPVNGFAHAKRDRWTRVKVMASERVNIRLTEIAAYDEWGDVMKIPFHVSVYSDHVIPEDMPWDQRHGQPDPFTTDAFDSTSEDVWVHPDPRLIIGWGDADQKAGYWPGLETNGDPETGMLRDESSWEHTLERSYYHIYLMFYAEYPCWFMGRLYATIE